MLIDLKVLCLACKCLFHRPEQNKKGWTHENEFWRFWKQNWNIPIDRAQRADEKNGVIFLFIIFSPKVMVVNMSKITIFCIFCWLQQKIGHSLSKAFQYIAKILLNSFRKSYRWLARWLATISKMSFLENIELPYIFCWISSIFIFLPSISQ